MRVRALNGSSGGSAKAFYNVYSTLPQEIDVGFTPKYVMVSVRYATSHNMTFIFDADTSTTKYYRRYDSGETYDAIPAGSSYAGFIKVGTDSKIQINLYGSMTSAYVMAMG